MNIKTKKLKLMSKGLSESTLSKLTDSEINLLFEETQVPIKATLIKPGMETTSEPMTVVKQAGKLYGVPKESEMKENLDDSNALGTLAMQKVTGQQARHDASDMAPDGMDDDSDNDRRMMDKVKKKKNNKKNPWAICTTQMGKEFGTTKRSDWSKSDARKYERCVNDVKKTIEEGKNPVSLFIEQKITQIVEKHLSPSITKGELLKYLSEAPVTAPPKPKTPTKPSKPVNPFQNPRPDVGPSPARAGEPAIKEPPVKPKTPTKPTRPVNPFQNPRPDVGPSPARAKRISPERAKDIVINTILNLL